MQDPMKRLSRAAVLAMAALLAAPWGWAGDEVAVARDGRALLPVVVAAPASVRVKAAAADLAAVLGRITGARFEVVTGDGRTGLAVGCADDFPLLRLAADLDAPEPAHREQYLLRSHGAGVYIVGATELAVEHAVWDLLHRLGYRQFFPGAHWEVVPNLPDLNIAVAAKELPAYLNRRIWYGWGDWADVTLAKRVWDTRNRAVGALDIRSGHAYEAIISANQKEFDQHPEYRCAPKSSKLCVSNPGLRQLVVDYALRYFEANPEADSISMEPSDGGGWENAEEEKAFTSVSDRVVTLANAVAAAVTQRFPGKLVGIYAYYQHSPPPTLRVHPNVVVSIATAFIQGGYTVEQLMDGWSRQGAALGVREYYSVVVGHKDRPGGPGAADPRRVAASIARYYALGARYMSAESSGSWGPAGPGYYVAARLLWNPREDPEAILDDFLTRAFGPARAPMAEFYRLIDRASKPLFTRHLLGSMYRQLDAARQLTADPGIRSRLDDLVLYTRYAELLFNLFEGDDKPAGTQATLGFAYRIRNTHMVHSYALWRDTRGGFTPLTRDLAFNLPEPKRTARPDDLVADLLPDEAPVDVYHPPTPSDLGGLEALQAQDARETMRETLGVPAKAVKTHPWKSSDPFAAADIERFVREGIANNPVAGFTPVQFSEDLVPAATRLKLKTPVPGRLDAYVRHRLVYLAWLPAPGTLHLEVTGGQISTAGKPEATLSLSAAEDPTAGVAASTKAPLDLQAHPVELTSPFKGLHRLEVAEGGRGAALRWPEGTAITIPSSPETQTLLRGRGWELYFYVPAGTRVVGGVADGAGEVLDSDGRVLHRFAGSDRLATFSVTVPPGQDGKLWRFAKSSGRRLLMTVPPYLARSAEELLLPREVVEADARPAAQP